MNDSPALKAILPTLILRLALALPACQSSGDERSDMNGPHVVEMTATDYAFQMPDSM